MDVKVGDLVSIKSDFPGRNINIHHLSSLGVVTKIFQSAMITAAKGEHNYRDCAEVEWIKFDESRKGRPDMIQATTNLVIVSES